MNTAPEGAGALPAVLDGRPCAAQIRAEVAAAAAQSRDRGLAPRLAVVVATEDGSAAWYVRSIARAAEKSGLLCDIVALPADSGAARVRATLERLSADPAVHGVILQTPLPEGVGAAESAAAIDPAKDVDGAAPLSLGRLVAGLPAFAPATAEAVVRLLDHHGVRLPGRTVAVVGRSTVVGKPLAHLLLDRDATVTVAHSRTADLAAVTRQADIVVAAAGRIGLITSDHVGKGAIVVDVGTNPTPEGGLAGDVAADVAGRAASVSPVPGGIGPITTALLLRHTVLAAQRSFGD